MSKSTKASPFEKIAASIPQSATAARVVSRGVHYEPTLKHDGNFVTGDLPLPMKTPTNPEAIRVAQELVGKTFGRLTVKGLAEGKSNPARWVVRCSCGRWEHRKAKTLRGDPERLACSHCDKTKEYAKMYRQQGGKSVEDFFAKQLEAKK